MRFRTQIVCLALLAAVWAGSAVSQARADDAFGGITDFTIWATSGSATGSYTVNIPEDPSGVTTWSLSGPVDIVDPSNTSNVLATLDTLDVVYDAEPGVTLNFSATAGAAVTTITVNSAIVSFTSLVNPTADATASLTVTDRNNNGATANGLETGLKAYEAKYNTNAGTPGVYADLILTPLVAPSGGSAIGSERMPPVTGQTTITGTVFDISSQYKFNLTASDSASGTSRFNVVPEPGMIGLLAIAGALSLRRRRA